MQRLLSTLILYGALAAAAPTFADGRTTAAFKGAGMLPAASITLAAARATALEARPGKVIDEELEKEAGGSGLRYSFDIRSGSKTFEVGIDAKTGRILENAAEGKNPD